MSVIRSLELVSESRDRNLYPNPADFSVNVNEMKTSNIALAANPTTYAYPIKGFMGAEAVTAGLYGNILGPGTPGAPYLNSRAKPLPGYYNGMILENMRYQSPQSTSTIAGNLLFNGTAGALPDETGNSVIVQTTVAGPNLHLSAHRQDNAGTLTAAITWVNNINAGAGPGVLNGNHAIEISRPNYLNQLPGSGSTQTGGTEWFVINNPRNVPVAGLRIFEAFPPTSTVTSVFGNTSTVGNTALQNTALNFLYMGNVMTITGINGPIIRNVVGGGGGTLVTAAVDGTNITITPNLATNQTAFATTSPQWFENQQPIVNSFVCIRCILANGQFCGGTFLVLAIGAQTFTISGILRENSGVPVTLVNAAGDTAITSITVKNVNVGVRPGGGNLLYNGTGNNVFRDLGTNILKFVNVTASAAAPGVGSVPFLNSQYLTNSPITAGNYNDANIITINSPADETFGSPLLTVYTGGSYTSDGSNFLSFHDTPYLVLDSMTTSPDGVIQNNFSMYNDSISIQRVDQGNIGWLPGGAAGANFDFLIHKPPAINFTRCLDPNNKYSGITLTNPYGAAARAGINLVTLNLSAANIALLTGNSIIETYNLDSISYFGNVFTQVSAGTGIPVASTTSNMSFIPVQATPGFSFSNTIQLPTSTILGSNASYTFPRSTPIGMSFTTTRQFSLYTVSNGIVLDSSPILSYEGNTGLATLHAAFNTANWAPLTTMWKINNETNILDNTKILIQNGSIVENRYANYFLDNLDQIPRNRTNLIPITSYDSSTKIATLASALNSPTPAHEFYIRRIPAAKSSTTPGSVFVQNVPTRALVQTAGTGYTAGQFVNGGGVVANITFAINVTGVNATGGITAFTILYALGNQGIGTRITIDPPAAGTSAILSISGTSQGVDISALTTQPSGSVVNTFIFLSKGLLTDGTGPITEVNPDIPSTTTATSSYTGIVVADYNSANVTALVGISNLTRIVAMKNNILPNAASPTAVVSGATSFAGILEFLAFAGDSKNSLEFNASTITTAGQSCYQISLLDLILPNQELDNYMGGIIAFYPYVYVELQKYRGTDGTQSRCNYK